jgi:hypothetical protein
MFEHLDRDDHEDGSAERSVDAYGDRRRHHVGWFVHDGVAHPRPEDAP